jgi:hypothetical protein
MATNYERSFNITATTGGAKLTPPAATLAALNMASGSKLYAYNRLWLQNIGDDTVTFYTDEDGAPANAGEATVAVLTLEPKQRDFIPARHIDFEDYIDTESFYAISASGSQVVIVTPE